MKEITIIAQGGGMVTAYHAGVIKGLQEKIDVSKVNHIVASSGAAAVFTYFISKQIELIEPIWKYLVTSKRFVTPFSHPSLKGVINIDFLIDNAIKQEFPLDLKRFKDSPVKFDIGVTNAITGKPKFFSKNDDVDYYELLRASCAIPYFYGKKIGIGNDFYYDGTIGDQLGLDCAKEDKNIIIILTRRPRPIRKMTFFRYILRWLLIRKETPELQKTIWEMPFHYNNIQNVIREFSKDKNVLVIQPRKSLPIKRIDTRLNKLEKTIKQGYLDTITNKNFNNFIHNL